MTKNVVQITMVSMREEFPACEHGCAGVGQDDGDYGQHNHNNRDEDVDNSLFRCASIS